MLILLFYKNVLHKILDCGSTGMQNRINLLKNKNCINSQRIKSVKKNPKINRKLLRQI